MPDSTEATRRVHRSTAMLPAAACQSSAPPRLRGAESMSDQLQPDGEQDAQQVVREGPEPSAHPL